MAPRNNKIAKNKMVEIDDYAEEEKTESFQDEVEQELAFLQKFPVSDLDNKARKEAEIEREIEIRKMRKSKRNYNGPPLVLESAKTAEKVRLDEIRKEFNRASARRSRVRKVAKVRYLHWANRKLEKMFEKSKEELKIENFYSTNYKKSITAAVENNKILRNQVHGKTGNGNGY